MPHIWREVDNSVAGEHDWVDPNFSSSPALHTNVIVLCTPIVLFNSSFQDREQGFWFTKDYMRCWVPSPVPDVGRRSWDVTRFDAENPLLHKGKSLHLFFAHWTFLCFDVQSLTSHGSHLSPDAALDRSLQMDSSSWRFFQLLCASSIQLRYYHRHRCVHGTTMDINCLSGTCSMQRATFNPAYGGYREWRWVFFHERKSSQCFSTRHVSDTADMHPSRP